MNVLIEHIGVEGNVKYVYNIYSNGDSRGNPGTQRSRFSFSVFYYLFVLIINR
jgi:hypothetical protein